MRARTVEILESATSKIEGGWCQHHAVVEKEGVLHYCIAGAVESSMNPMTRETMPSERAAALEAYEVIQHILGTTPIICWNDTYRRRKEEVVEVMKKAVEAARKRAEEERGKVFDNRMPTHVPIITVLLEWEEVEPRELVNV